MTNFRFAFFGIFLVSTLVAFGYLVYLLIGVPTYGEYVSSGQYISFALLLTFLLGFITALGFINIRVRKIRK